MTTLTPKDQALAARLRRLKCAWCGRPITTYHSTVRYCPGGACKLEAKRARWRRTLAARRAGVEGLGVQQGEQAKSVSVEPQRGARRRNP